MMGVKSHLCQQLHCLPSQASNINNLCCSWFTFTGLPSKQEVAFSTLLFWPVPSGWGAPALLVPSQQHPCGHWSQPQVGSTWRQTSLIPVYTNSIWHTDALRVVRWLSQSCSHVFLRARSQESSCSKDSGPNFEKSKLESYLLSRQALVTFNSSCERGGQNPTLTTLL